jgi:hypothetical protein
MLRSMPARGLRIALVAVAALTPACAAVSAGSRATDPRRIPIGDGHVSSTPRVGYVDSCQTHFGNAPGAFRAGPWIRSDGTWDSTAKVKVRGSVRWPAASFSSHVSGGRRVLRTRSLPVGQLTGTFPVSSSDPAYSYDRNPNRIRAQSLTISAPANPRRASRPTCVSLGAIGVLSDGVALFNALDAGGRDAAAHEVLDRCDGHPERSGMYHHHAVASCVLARAKGRSTLVGYARDGFGIYVERDSSGNLLSNGALDECHGRTSIVRFGGRTRRMYHYVATREYPYTVGCYRGTPSRVSS